MLEMASRAHVATDIYSSKNCILSYFLIHGEIPFNQTENNYSSDKLAAGILYEPDVHSLGMLEMD